jgi:hypothetical protein
MPANFHQVSPSVWDKTFRGLSREAKLLALYVWTGPTRISEGLFAVAPGHIMVDTGLTQQEILDAFEELSEAELIDYDAEAEVVLDLLALRRSPIRNGIDAKTGEIRVDKRIVNAVKRFDAVPDTNLKIKFMVLADAFAPDLSDAIREDQHYTPPEKPRIDKPPLSPLEGASKPPSRSRAEPLGGEAESRRAGTKPDTERVLTVVDVAETFNATEVENVGDWKAAREEW